MMTFYSATVPNFQPIVVWLTDGEAIGRQHGGG
jgi:hypothetical protein